MILFLHFKELLKKLLFQSSSSVRKKCAHLPYKRSAQKILRSDKKFFYHPDYTVGFGISPNQESGLAPGARRRLMPKSNHCRWGIAPRPKELTLKNYVHKIFRLVTPQNFRDLGNQLPLAAIYKGSLIIKSQQSPSGELAHATNRGLLRRETLLATSSLYIAILTLSNIL